MRLRWWIVPIVVTLVLVGSWALARSVRFPTQTVAASGQAPEPGAEARAVEFTVQNLKCWTMSNVFTEMMTQERGVIEVQTFVRTHTALITYDPAMTSPQRLAERINEPIRNPQTGQPLRVFQVQEMKTR